MELEKIPGICPWMFASGSNCWRTTARTAAHMLERRRSDECVVILYSNCTLLLYNWWDGSHHNLMEIRCFWLCAQGSRRYWYAHTIHAWNRYNFAVHVRSPRLASGSKSALLPNQYRITVFWHENASWVCMQTCLQCSELRFCFLNIFDQNVFNSYTNSFVSKHCMHDCLLVHYERPREVLEFRVGCTTNRIPSSFIFHFHRSSRDFAWNSHEGALLIQLWKRITRARRNYPHWAGHAASTHGLVRSLLACCTVMEISHAFGCTYVPRGSSVCLTVTQRQQSFAACTAWRTKHVQDFEWKHPQIHICQLYKPYTTLVVTKTLCIWIKVSSRISFDGAQAWIALPAIAIAVVITINQGYCFTRMIAWDQQHY